MARCQKEGISKGDTKNIPCEMTHAGHLRQRIQNYLGLLLPTKRATSFISANYGRDKGVALVLIR